MTTSTRLSQRQDLLEGIHADGVLCYLIRHGVLEPTVVADLGKKATARQINATILRHVERQGKTAVPLLINALRQSWQLHLAHSLDPERRIQPAPGNSYLGKDRHKGEVTIIIQIEALKITVQKNWQQETVAGNIMCQDLTSEGRDFRQKASQLPEKITDELTKSHDLNTSTRSDEVDGMPLQDEDDADFIKPKSCWCFCLFRKKKSKCKKDVVKQKTAEGCKLDKMNKITPDVNLTPSQNVKENKIHLKYHRKKLKEKKRVTTDAKESTHNKSSVQQDQRSKDKYSNRKLISSKSGISERYSATENTDELGTNQLHESRSLSQVDIRFLGGETADVKQGRGDEMGRTDQLDSSLGLKDSRWRNAEHFHKLLHQPYIQTTSDLNIKSTSQKEKETWDSISTDYNHRLDLATLKVNNNNLIKPTSQSGNTEVTYQDLTSEDRDFKKKTSQLCEKITHELRTEIIKYFEQERGILILDLAARDNAAIVVCICMACSHVRSLQQDIQSGALLRKIEDMFAKVDTTMFEIQEFKLKIVVDDKEMHTVLGELS